MTQNLSIDTGGERSITILFNRMRSNSLNSSIINKEEVPNAPHLMITDVATHFDELADFDQVDTEESHKFFNFSTIEMWTILMLLAIIVPIISTTFCFCIEIFTENVTLPLIEEKTFMSFVFCLLISVTLAFTGCTICYFHQDAEGSGIPELKSTLAGISLYKYFSFRTLIIKIISLFFSIGSGLFVGKEGPFVHISASVANNLAKIPYFKKIHSKHTFKKQILATAGGIGITATFGTPIGGCLYSIETLSTFFPVGAFWKSFFCSFICSIVFHGMGSLLGNKLFAETDFKGKLYQIDIELIFYCILGVVCGVIGALHVKVIEFLLLKRKIIKTNILFSRYLYTAFVCFLTIFILFYIWDFGFLNEKASITLFNSAYNKNEIDIWWKLLLLIVLKFICNAFGVTCPIPTGIFVPMFLTGALIGRLYGIVLVNIFGENVISHIGKYSVVGAGALVSGVTHTLAMAVITLEVTGDMVLLFPLLVGVITAYYVSKAITLSVYYIILEIKDLPLLPKILKPVFYSKFVKDIMEVDFPFLTPDSTYGDIGLVLSHLNFKVSSVPIIDQNTRELIGSTQSASLRNYLYKEGKRYRKTQKSKLIKKGSIPLEETFFGLSNDMILAGNKKTLPKDINELNEISVTDNFWERKIDIYNPILMLDQYPFTVSDNISIARVHFLFSMLGLISVYVMNQGNLVGVISIETFQKKNN